MLINFNENVLSYSHDHCTEIIRCMVGPFQKDNLLNFQGLCTVKHPFFTEVRENGYKKQEARSKKYLHKKLSW